MACKTFKALYDFQGSTEGTLAFKQNDLLTVVQPVDENWHFGCKSSVYGFIPVKYVKEVEEKNYAYMLQCVSACIDKLQQIPEKNATKDEISALRKLKKCRDALCAEMSSAKQMPAVATPAVAVPVVAVPVVAAPTVAVPVVAAPAVATPAVAAPTVAVVPVSKQSQKQPPEPQHKLPAMPHQLSRPGVKIPANLTRQLVESVRANTNAPHRDCVQAVKQLLVTLESQLADQSEELASIIRQLAEQILLDAREELLADTKLDSTVTESRDWKAFNRLLSMAETRRQDWQERGGWSLHEQESQVLADLSQLTDLLTSCQPSVARLRVRLDGCAAPLCLAELHAAETRPAVRLALVDCLAAMCGLDRLVVDALLGHTTLATDLLTAVMSAATPSVGGSGGGDASCPLVPSLNLLALVFSTHLRPPNAVLDALNEPFFTQLLSHLALDEGDGCGESLLRAIFAFLLTANNLTAEYSAAALSVPVQERPLFRALLGATSGCRQALTEAILVAFNRAEDPTALLVHSPPPHDSVMKMLVDLFSHESTVSGLFYSGDIQVLLDVLIRELYNASPDTKRLPQLMELLGVCTSTAAYRASPYKRYDLLAALRQLHEQDALSETLRSQSQSLCQGLA